MSRKIRSQNTEKRYNTSLPGATTMHVGMMCIAGLFFASQVIRLVYSTVSGTEDLGTVQFAALVVVMGLLAALSFFFAGYMWYCIRKTRNGKQEDSDSEVPTEGDRPVSETEESK